MSQNRQSDRVGLRTEDFDVSWEGYVSTGETYCSSTGDHYNDSSFSIWAFLWLHAYKVLEHETRKIESPGEVNGEGEVPDIEAMRLVVRVDDLGSCSYTCTVNHTAENCPSVFRPGHSAVYGRLDLIRFRDICLE